jgi:hypothetical protein
MLTRDGPQWSWQGAVAVFLGAGICLTMLLITGGVAWKLSRGLPLASITVNLLTATLSSLVGAVATFLGRVATNPADQRKIDAHDAAEAAKVEAKVDAAKVAASAAGVESGGAPGS